MIKINIILAAVIVMSTIMGGCAGMSGTQEKQVALVLSKCPVLKNYTKNQLKAAAQEVKNLPSESQVAIMVTDYGKLRDACRVATKKLKQKFKN